MGPRSFDRGKDTPLRRENNIPDLLQWGRDLSIAERRPRAIIAALKVTLQWGRDLSIAERGLTPVGGDRNTRFNGAAIFRSRKGRFPLAFTTRKDTRFNGAAIFRSRKAAAR